MRVLALLIVCAVAATQSTENATKNGVAAVTGEAPWLVQLTVAYLLSGYPRNCAGSLISSSWVLTAGDCVHDVRSPPVVWVRLGCTDMDRPELVLESTAARAHPLYAGPAHSGPAHSGPAHVNLGLVQLPVSVETTVWTIRPITLGSGLPFTGKFCGFGEESDHSPGHILRCFEGSVSAASTRSDEFVINSHEGRATQYDVGAPLTDGRNRLIGVLIAEDSRSSTSNEGTFFRVENYVDWIYEETGINVL